MDIRNFFDGIEPPSKGERFDILCKTRNLVIERIVSSSDITSEQYVQEQDEWVMLLRGQAVLLVDGEEVTLKEGDFLFIPAKTPHTVQKTSGDALWLAIHLHPESSER